MMDPLAALAELGVLRRPELCGHVCDPVFPRGGEREGVTARPSVSAVRIRARRDLAEILNDVRAELAERRQRISIEQLNNVARRAPSPLDALAALLAEGGHRRTCQVAAAGQLACDADWRTRLVPVPAERRNASARRMTGTVHRVEYRVGLSRHRPVGAEINENCEPVPRQAGTPRDWCSVLAASASRGGDRARQGNYGRRSRRIQTIVVRQQWTALGRRRRAGGPRCCRAANWRSPGLEFSREYREP